MYLYYYNTNIKKEIRKKPNASMMIHIISTVLIPWYRVHIVVLNDVSRLISVHLVHTSLISGWSCLMTLYELVVLDSTDPTYNPIWRQGGFVSPFGYRLGLSSISRYWKEDTVAIAHIPLGGLLLISSIWHWLYWDLELFIDSDTINIDLFRVFSIHLTLASLLCTSYGLYHISGLFGPGIFTSDAYGILGTQRAIKPIYSIGALTTYSYGSISSHHLSAGILGIGASIWHLISRPGPTFFKLFRMYNIESILSSSLSAVFIPGIISASTMWYGSSTTVLDLYGTTRYNWDNSYFSLDIESRVKTSSWSDIPDKLLLYDYIGCNPSKGGLFRSGPQVLSDGIVSNWVGHAIITSGTISVTVRRMPAFFETFPVLLIDKSGTVRADIPFRRASSTFSIEQMSVSLLFAGGVLDTRSFSTTYVLKSYIRKAQFGEIFTFDRKILSSDGVYRTHIRGWYSFTHVTLSLIFFYGHLWHASRSLFSDIWTGVQSSTLDVEYGSNEKLGSSSTTQSLGI